MNRAKLLAPGLSAVFCLWAAGTTAADLPPTPAPNGAPPPVPFNWTGVYLGGHMGAAFDGSNFSNPYGPTLFGDNVRSPGAIGGLQVGYNKQYGATVLGVEAEMSWAQLDGTFTCLQPVRSLPSPPLFPVPPGFIGGAFGATCRVQPDLFGTLTGRIGTTFGDHGRALVYAKGGLAWIHDNVEIATNNNLAGFAGPPNATSNASFTQWGWTVGAGVEYALTGNWSARLEYDFLGFGSHDVPTPNAVPILSPALGIPAVPGILGSSAPDGRAASISQGVHAVKLGVNYRFGDNPAPWPSEWPAIIVPAPVGGPGGFEVEIGARYVHGWGRFQQDLSMPSNASRLTWDGLGTDGAETFWRIDGPYRLMTKGFLGEGGGHSGHINDEDWGLEELPLVIPYSNTQDPAGSTIRYLIADIGYNLLMGPGYRLSPFVGYSHFSQGMSNFDGVNIAFAPPMEGEPVVGLLQFNTWNALRLGTAADLLLMPRLKLSADAAWLPDVRFEGLDIHTINTAGSSTQSGTGSGVQLEAILSYYLTDQFSVGVGGRYWAILVPDGTNIFPNGRTRPGRFAAEQAAVFLQASYKFGVLCCAGLFR